MLLSPRTSQRIKANDRAQAARRLARVLGKGIGLDVALNGKESALCLELIYGCLRHYFSLSDALNAKLSRPLRSKDLDVYALMLVGAYQLQRMRIPRHAAINETVTAVRPLGKPWAAALVNGLLRKLPTKPDAAKDAPSHRPQLPSPDVAAKGAPAHRLRSGASQSAACDHPPWLRQRIEREYPEQAKALLDANNRRAPLCLRVNRARIPPDEYRRQLRQANLSFAGSWLPESIILHQPQPATTLPGHAQGWFAVQDVGAQLVGDLMRRQLGNGQRVLDACAAPGGKLFHLLETGLKLDVTALDISPTRLADLGEIAERLRHRRFKAVAADATVWQGRRHFDFVLLDAPCSGSGTLRRHPDIKVIRTAGQVARAAALQAALLRNLWRMVRRGCTLLYCTCSMLAEENDQVVAAFLNANGDAQTLSIRLPTGAATQHGWQMLPLEPSTDGFYVSLIGKRP